MDKKKLISFLLLVLLLAAWFFLSEPVPEHTAPSVSDGQLLTVHFLDVGQADCALLECDGKYMLIDGGNKEDGSLVIAYLQELGVEELEAVVCTHAHEDHVGGLPAVLAVYPTAAVYAPTRTYSSKVFDDFVYYTDQQRLEITIPSPGDSWMLGSAEITVLGPVDSYAETNDTSIVLMVRFGETDFLFTGDMEVAAENDMLDYWGDRVQWQTDVLKVGHHGSDTSSGYRFVNEVMPVYSVISVGQDNKYNHPNDEPLSRLFQAGSTVLRTDRLGWIIAVSDGQEVTFTWENSSRNPDNADFAESVTYVGNTNSMKFHTQDCSNLPREENRITFDSYQEAIDAGYEPCSSCLK